MDHYELGNAHTLLVKLAADAPTSVYSLSGQLYKSNSGWILLKVPNALVRGAFDAMDEPGIELPPSGPDENGLNAHISVIRPEELEAAGLTADDITERGKRFNYTLGPIQEVEPKGWGAMSKCWFIKCHSPALKQLRRSYGLTPLPNNNKFDFHITVAVRRKNVLRTGETRKAASFIHGGGVEQYFKKVAENAMPAPEPDDVLATLHRARSRSDVGDYRQKYQLLRQLMQRSPADFYVDTPDGKYHGITHRPTGYQFHLPPVVYQDLLAEKQASLGYAVRKSDIHGQGTFATRDYEPGDRIGLALQFNREGDDGVKEYDRTVLGRFVNYQKEGNATLQEDDKQLYLHATRPIASGEEIYTQPYEKDLEEFQPLTISQGYKQAVDMNGSWYGSAAKDYMNNALAGNVPLWDANESIMANVGKHFGNIRNMASNRIRQAENYGRFQAALDPNYAVRQMSSFLSGQRQPIINHPVDAILHGRFGN